MLEVTGNIWSYLGKADVICVTTNGIIRTDGTAVMGRGIALQAKQKFPDIEKLLASQLKTYGNTPAFLMNGCISPNITQIWSFPTKNHWRDPSDLSLI